MDTENFLREGHRSLSSGAFGAVRWPPRRNGTTGAVSAYGHRAHYYMHDHLGSVIGLFSGSGIWLGGYSYSPYGEERFTATNAAVADNVLRYIAGELDESGLYKLGARYYDPTQGRFTQTDPSGQEVNPYLYAACNPVNASDATGLLSCDAVLDILTIIGIATVAMTILGLGPAAWVSLIAASAALPVALSLVATRLVPDHNC